MSASDKKKLRKELETELLTARQRQEQAEAKKLRTITIAFVSAMALVICIALGSLIVSGIQRSGIAEKSTIAATIGDEKLNSVMMSYYYNDAINEMYSNAYTQYSDYASMYFESIGLDLSTPLDEQINSDTEETWAQFFIDSALDSAKSDYAISKAAKEAGFTLPEEDLETLENNISNIATMATINYGVSSDAYLAMIYGNGASVDSYREYLERTALADAYYEHYYNEISYTDEDIRAYDKEHTNDFNAYNYSYSYLSYTESLEGGTEDEDGNKTYSDDEKAAARAALKEAADSMAAAKSLDEMIELSEKVEVNETSQVAVNSETDKLHTDINATLASWLADSSRKQGDIAAVANTSAEDENEVNGYYVVYFDSMTDNNTAMGNVRHLLVSFEGGTEDETTGQTVYSDEEKAAAKEEAEELLKQWQDGEATEESFIELVKEHSDDGNAAEGGLYEDINPATSFVSNFLQWCINQNRKVGDVEIVETEYGYHIMYYVGASELSYRDHMISEQMKTTDRDTWYNGLLEAATVTEQNMSKIKTDLIISG